METGEQKRYELVMKLYGMSLDELKKFKALAYGNISPTVDKLIDTAIAIKG